MPEPDAAPAVRIVASPEALDTIVWPAGTRVMRTAPDELLALTTALPEVDDPHAIVITDTGWARFRLSPDQAVVALAGLCEWAPPEAGFAQGLVAGIPTKLWIDPDETILVVPLPYCADLQRRLDHALGVVR